MTERVTQVLLWPDQDGITVDVTVSGVPGTLSGEEGRVTVYGDADELLDWLREVFETWGGEAER